MSYSALATTPLILSQSKVNECKQLLRYITVYFYSLSCMLVELTAVFSQHIITIGNDILLYNERGKCQIINLKLVIIPILLVTVLKNDTDCVLSILRYLYWSTA